MVSYFEENLYDTIIEHAGRWVLEKGDNYNPYSGITNNGAESINAKLKRLVDFKEREIDSIVLFLNYLQGNDVSEILRAFCGESELTLLDRFKFAKKDPETVILPKNVCHPDNLIQLIKGQLSAICKDHSELKSPVKIPPVTDTRISNEAEINNLENQESTSNVSSVTDRSQHSLAIKTINDNGIVLVPEMAAFMVKGSNQTKYSVTLFPKETCNCPSTTRCYHIIAAMIAIGMPVSQDKKKYNLSQLRRNCRSRPNKKCGTKKGRVGDRDDDFVNPAPDSAIKLKNTPKTPHKCEYESDSNENKENSKTPTTVNQTPIFATSTPKSILKSAKNNINSSTKTVNDSTNKKKRKLTFIDERNETAKKIPKIQETSFTSINDDMLELGTNRNESTDDNKKFIM
jgi:hypothetical protein